MKENFVPIRLGIQDHLLRGEISLFELGVYVLIHLQADYSTGIWRGSAARIAATASRGIELRKIQRATEHLTDLGLLRPLHRHGTRGNYPVLINKFTVRRGALKGRRLNAIKSESLSNLIYEVCADGDAETDAEDAPIQEVRGKRTEENQFRRKKTAPGDCRSQPFIDSALASYKNKHGRQPIWQGKDFSALKRLLKSQSVEKLTLDRLTELWKNYTSSTEPFTVKQGNSLAYFCSNVDKFSDGPILADPRKGTNNGKPTVSDNIRATLEAFRATEPKLPA
jgi:hypothetical protein